MSSEMRLKLLPVIDKWDYVNRGKLEQEGEPPMNKIGDSLLRTES